jgi:hypothetical protein
MHLNTIFALFTLLAVPLWALPLQDEYVPRDVIPTEALEGRGKLRTIERLADTGLTLADAASKLNPNKWVHLFFLPIFFTISDRPMLS